MDHDGQTLSRRYSDGNETWLRSRVLWVGNRSRQRVSKSGNDIRRPFLGAEHVVRYFARYTRRIAISDRRLVRYDGHQVTFRWRDRADANRQKLLSLEGSLFAQRFLQHVLPPRFVRIRRYGLLSNRVRDGLLARCRELLYADRPLMLAPPGEMRVASGRRIFGVDLERCSKCRDGTLVVRARWRTTRLVCLATRHDSQPGRVSFARTRVDAHNAARHTLRCARSSSGTSPWVHTSPVTRIERTNQA
jgi:hypothetical protein